jgi:hypothetical protein
MEPIDFEHFARECRRLADQIPIVEDKALLLTMAQVWICLADEGEHVQALLDKNNSVIV